MNGAQQFFQHGPTRPNTSRPQAAKHSLERQNSTGSSRTWSWIASSATSGALALRILRNVRCYLFGRGGLVWCCGQVQPGPWHRTRDSRESVLVDTHVMGYCSDYTSTWPSLSWLWAVSSIENATRETLSYSYSPTVPGAHQTFTGVNPRLFRQPMTKRRILSWSSTTRTKISASTASEVVAAPHSNRA